MICFKAWRSYTAACETFKTAVDEDLQVQVQDKLKLALVICTEEYFVRKIKDGTSAAANQIRARQTCISDQFAYEEIHMGIQQCVCNFLQEHPV